MQNLRVAYVITKLELGGAQKGVLYLAEKLNRDKYDVYLISGKEGILTDEAIKLKSTNVILLPELKHEINLFYDIVVVFKLSKLFRKYGINIVHTHSSKAGIVGRIAAKLSGVPVILHTIHGFSFNDFQGFFKKRLFILLEKIVSYFTDRFIAVSSTDIDKGIKNGLKDRDAYTIIRCGINIELFSKKVDTDKKKKELDIPLNSIVIGMVACLKPQKAPLDFVEVAHILNEKFNNLIFIIVGDGILKNKIKEKVQSYNLQQKFILVGWRSDVNEIIKTFDIFVLTSLWEGLPRVFLEAMASYKPVVATDVDGARDVIKDGENGFLVQPGNVNLMAQKIEYLINNKALIKSFGKRGRELLSEEFNQNLMVKKTEALYEELTYKKSSKVAVG